jgi:tetratricopeptide (TPR) repeat protein
MNTVKHSRLAPAAILAVCGAAAAFALRTSGLRPVETAAGNTSALRAQLEQRIGQGRTDAGLWRQYGDCLLRLKDYPVAADAFAKALEQDPMNRDVRFLRASALASAGDADLFYGAVSDLMLDDPRLTCEILDRTGSRAYLAAARFRRLRDEARAQSVD